MAHQGNPNQSPTLAHPLKEQPIDQGNKKLNVCEIVDDCNKLFEEAGQIMVMVNQWKEENNSDTTQPTDEQRRDLIRQLQTMISNAQSIQGKLKDNGLDATTPSDNVEAAKTDENLSDELTDNSALSTAATQTENLTPKSTDSEPALSDDLEDEKPDDEDSLEADEESTDDKLQFSSPTAKAPSSANTEAQENAGESLAIKNDSSSNTVEQVRADDQVSDQVTDQSVSPTNQPVEPASFGNLEIEKTDMMDSSDVSNGIVERIERCKEAQMKDLQQILAKRKSLDPKNKTECERLDRSRKEGLALLEELDTMHTLEVIRTQDTERKQFVADATKSTNQKDKIKNSTVLERQLHNHRVGRELSSEIKKLQIPDDFLQKHTRYSTDMCRKARYGMTKSFGKKALLRFRNSITIFKQQQKEAGSPKKRATETDEELLIPTKKIRLEQVPVEGEQVPVEGEQVPVEGEQVPVEGEQVPVEGEQKEAPVVVDMPELFDDEPIEGLDQFRELQVQADYMKLSIHVILTMFLGAVDDIKTGKRKNTRQELCTPRIEEYIKHVSKHGKNYAQFNVNNYINEQKMNRTGKNVLLYTELENMLKKISSRSPSRNFSTSSVTLKRDPITQRLDQT